MANDTSMSTSEAGRRGGKAQGKENNPGNFANDRQKASAAGREGAANQPIEAKKKVVSTATAVAAKLLSVGFTTTVI